MRYMLLVSGSKQSEAGVKLSLEVSEAMNVFHASLERAGVLLAADRLLPSSSGIRISYPGGGGEPCVKVGPFESDGSLLAGFTLIEVSSEAEAIQWALRMPDPYGGGVELRRLDERKQEQEQEEPHVDPRIHGVETYLLEQRAMLQRLE
ncbi:YciI family protein [Paenibacillus sp. GCM10023252]|uniref:YciI family protein n=1 Tax=Paenibacillus sp. GCM10023252 TaxID=3252649 RepID=UPI003614DF61